MSDSVWIVIHMAHSEKAAEEVCTLLTNEGFMVRQKAVYRNVSSEENYYEILVIKSEAQEARNILMERSL